MEDEGPHWLLLHEDAAKNAEAVAGASRGHPGAHHRRAKLPRARETTGWADSSAAHTFTR